MNGVFPAFIGSARHQIKRRKKLMQSPFQVIALSFLCVILAGTLLLALPISAKSGTSTPLLDCLFTATSATCVTGLVVYDTFTHWTLFGQTVILLLIQIGGLGLLSFTSFFNMIIGKKLGLRGLRLLEETTGAMNSDLRRLLSLVFKTSILVEGLGAVLLGIVLVPQFGAEGAFISVFTAISAYCNAGFDLFGRLSPYISVVPFAQNPFVLGVIGALIVIGGLGFIVIYDLLYFKKNKLLTLHSRVVLSITAVLILTGLVFTAALEWNNPATLGNLTTVEKLYNSLFHSVSSRTAGMNSFSLSDMRDPTKLLTCVLMFIGAAPGSTGGGVKCTTVAVVLMTVVSVVRGREETIIFGRRVDSAAVYKSLAVVVLGIFAVCATAGAIMITMSHTHAVKGIDAVFESVSAFATVGYSVGVSTIMNPIAKWLTIFSMYIGRLGPVTFFLSLAMRTPTGRRKVLPDGKIQIG